MLRRDTRCAERISSIPDDAQEVRVVFPLTASELLNGSSAVRVTFMARGGPGRPDGAAARLDFPHGRATRGSPNGLRDGQTARTSARARSRRRTRGSGLGARQREHQLHELAGQAFPALDAEAPVPALDPDGAELHR